MHVHVCVFPLLLLLLESGVCLVTSGQLLPHENLKHSPIPQRPAQVFLLLFPSSFLWLPSPSPRVFPQHTHTQTLSLLTFVSNHCDATIYTAAFYQKTPQMERGRKRKKMALQEGDGKKDIARQ